jgi:hypothetical protein
MAVWCQNLTLGALNSRNALSVLVSAQFKKFGLFLNTPSMFGPFTCAGTIPAPLYLQERALGAQAQSWFIQTAQIIYSNQEVQYLCSILRW